MLKIQQKVKKNKAMSLHQPIRSNHSFYVIESSRDGYVEDGTFDRLPIRKSRRGHHPSMWTATFWIPRCCWYGYSASCWQPRINGCPGESNHAYHHTSLEEEEKEEKQQKFSVWFVKIDKGIIIDNELTGLYGSGNLQHRRWIYNIQFLQYIRVW